MSLTQIEASNLAVTSTPSGSKNPLDVNISEIAGDVSIAGDFSPVGLKTQGRITMVTIDNSAWVEAPTVALTARNNIQIQNPKGSTDDIIYNYDNTAPLTSGIHIAPGTSVSIQIQGSIPVYIVAAAAETIISPVEELA